MNGQCLKHDPYPVYLGVTLDRTLSYREHLSRSAVKLKSRNNLITKLTGTSWGPVSEYCCPVWARSSHTSLIDTQLYNTMHLISGCLQPTQLSWLPVLSKVAPPTIIVKRQLTYASYHRSPSKLACVCWCLWASTSTACISMTSMVRYNVCRHNYTVERGLVVGFCGHPHHCYGPYYLTARFRSPWSYVVCDEPFPGRSRPMLCCLAQMGSRAIAFLWLWPATDHEPHSWHVPINKIWRWTESTPQSGWWRIHMARIYSDCSTHEIIITYLDRDLTLWRCVRSCLFAFLGWQLSVWSDMSQCASSARCRLGCCCS